MKKYIVFIILLDVCFNVSISSAKTLDWSYIDNGKIKIGVIKDWGASIAYFSRVSPERNLINYFDMGREVQQSYYGNVYGGNCAGFAPGAQAVWNPVQAGNAAGDPGQVLEFINNGISIYAKTIPKEWCLNDVDVNGYMEEWITLINDVAKIHFKFTYNGSVAQADHGQEAPAMFFDSSLQNSVSYKGVSPWSYEPLNYKVPTECFGAGGYITNNPENWAAYVNGNKWGIGVYKPGASNFLSCSVTGDSGPTGFGASYLSTGGNYAFAPGSVYEYDTYLTIGTLDEIRLRFYALHRGIFVQPFCGDSFCNNGETCSTCPSDCGVCSSSK